MGSKCKEVAAGGEEEQRPSKKARGKYRRGAAVKMGGGLSDLAHKDHYQRFQVINHLKGIKSTLVILENIL